MVESFTVLGAPLDTDAAAVQAGLNFSLNPGLKLSVSYDGNVGGRGQNHAVRAGLGWHF